MGDITRVITLGIGPGSDIPGLVLTGLNIGGEPVISWPYAPVVVSYRGERVYKSNLVDGVTAVLNTRQVRAIDQAYSSATLYVPTPGAELYLNQAGVTLTIDEIRGWYMLENPLNGGWAFEDGNLIGGG
jgi:hypothetical protein